MHGELTVRHKNGNLVASLQQDLGPHDALAVQTSIVLDDQPEIQALVEYATQTPAYRLLCWQNAPIELQAFVEPVGQGDIKEACQSVWDAIQESGKSLKPRLKRLDLTDETVGRELLVASTGFGARLGSRATLTALVVGGASLITLAVGLFTFAANDRANLLSGAAPALLAAALALLWAILDVVRGRLAWSG
jgi:hypothetical protein